MFMNNEGQYVRQEISGVFFLIMDNFCNYNNKNNEKLFFLVCLLTNLFTSLFTFVYIFFSKYNYIIHHEVKGNGELS